MHYIFNYININGIHIKVVGVDLNKVVDIKYCESYGYFVILSNGSIWYSPKVENSVLRFSMILITFNAKRFCKFVASFAKPFVVAISDKLGFYMVAKVGNILMFEFVQSGVLDFYFHGERLIEVTDPTKLVLYADNTHYVIFDKTTNIVRYYSLGQHYDVLYNLSIKKVIGFKNFYAILTTKGELICWLNGEIKRYLAGVYDITKSNYKSLLARMGDGKLIDVYHANRLNINPNIPDLFIDEIVVEQSVNKVANFMPDVFFG